MAGPDLFPGKPGTPAPLFGAVVVWARAAGAPMTEPTKKTAASAVIVFILCLSVAGTPSTLRASFRFETPARELGTPREAATLTNKPVGVQALGSVAPGPVRREEAEGWAADSRYCRGGLQFQVPGLLVKTLGQFG